MNEPAPERLDRQHAEADDVTARLEEVYAVEDDDRSPTTEAAAGRRLVEDGLWPS